MVCVCCEGGREGWCVSAVREGERDSMCVCCEGGKEG